MRRKRLKAAGHLAAAYYHCVSRVVNREYVLGAEEKGRFVELMRVYERLCGLRVVTYCVMSNHFHILVEVPRRPAAEELPDDAGLVALVRASLGDRAADGLAWELGHWRGQGARGEAEALRERWFGRMWDVSGFMKVLKQRFSQWFNGRHKRRGTLWEERFRSVLVEGAGNALRSMAAYIELNPVRAGICADPADYPWCGHASAVAGQAGAVAALRWLAALDPRGGPAGEEPEAGEALRRWRCWLYGVPENEAAQREEQAKGENARLFRRGVPREQALEVLAGGGRLSRASYLRCRVRYFSDGVALGGRKFVDGVFQAARERFGVRRADGARPLRGIELAAKPDRLYNLRQLQKNLFS